jgi:hypothetical protein
VQDRFEFLLLVFYSGPGLGHYWNEVSRLKKKGIGVWKPSWNECKKLKCINSRNNAIALFERLYSYNTWREG